MKQHSYSLYFGHRQPRGGQVIKEQMIVDAESYDDAVKKAYYFCRKGEEVLDIVKHN